MDGRFRLGLGLACAIISLFILRTFLLFANSKPSTRTPLSDRFTSSYFLGRPWYYYKHQHVLTSTECRSFCHFKNVCLTKKDDQHLVVKLFRHPDDAEYPLLVDGNGDELFNYPDNYCFRDIENTVLSYETVNYSLLNDNILERYDYILSTGSSIRDGNFGHHLWEYLMPIISLADMFGFNRSHTAFLNLYKSSEKYAVYDSLVGIHTQFLKSEQQVCVASIAIGDLKCLSRMYLSHEYDLFPTPTGFKRRFDEIYGVDQPMMRTITLLQKYGRRAPLNFNETLRFLRSRFAPIEVKVLDFSRTSVLDQINVLRNTFLLITPAGGISCAAPLLPRNSIVLQYGFHNTLLNTTSEYDSFFFSEFNHFSHHVFPILPNEIDSSQCPMDAEDLQQHHWGTHVYCSFWVNLSRLEKMTAHLIHEYSLYNGQEGIIRYLY